MTPREIRSSERAAGMTWYINRFGQGQRETVGEYPPVVRGSLSIPLTTYHPQRRRAEADCKEYRAADPSAHYYVSPRCCANWSKE